MATHIRPVGGSQHDDASVALKAVHLRQQLVDGLLALVVAAAHAGATLAADRINLIDEHNAGRLLLGLHESKEAVKCMLGEARESLPGSRSAEMQSMHTRQKCFLNACSPES